MKFSLAAVGALILFFLSSCVSNHLNYPIVKVDVPTDISVFVAMTSDFNLDNKRNIGTKEMFDFLRKDAMQKMLENLDVSIFRKALAEKVISEVKKSPKLFNLIQESPLDLDVQYGRSGEDAEGYSGYNFQYQADQIPTKYVLAINIQDWGYRASDVENGEGPYVVLNCQLVDRDTNESLWEYNYTQLEPFVKDRIVKTSTSELRGIFKDLTERGVHFMFQALR